LHYALPILYEDVRRYILFCEPCQKRRPSKQRHELVPIPVTEPFARIGIDVVGPLNYSRSGNRYLIVCTEYLTKWPEAAAVTEVKASDVAHFLLRKIIARHGCPAVILSDQGTHFRNQLIRHLCKILGIKHQLSSPYHPQTNGLTE